MFCEAVSWWSVGGGAGVDALVRCVGGVGGWWLGAGAGLGEGWRVKGGGRMVEGAKGGAGAKSTTDDRGGTTDLHRRPVEGSDSPCHEPRRGARSRAYGNPTSCKNSKNSGAVTSFSNLL